MATAHPEHTGPVQPRAISASRSTGNHIPHRMPGRQETNRDRTDRSPIVDRARWFTGPAAVRSGIPTGPTRVCR